MAAPKAQSFSHQKRAGTPTRFVQNRAATAAACLAKHFSKSPAPPSEIKTFARLSPDSMWDHASDDESVSLRYSNCRRRLKSRPHSKGAKKLMEDDGKPKETGNISSALERFKTIALTVQKRINWKKNLERTRQLLDMMSSAYSSTLDSRAATPTFRVTAYTPKSYRTLSLRAKFILMQPSEKRTKEELDYVNQFTNRLKCFNHYPLFVRKELTKVLYYETIPRGSVVIKQGDVAFSFYVVLSGSVRVEKERLTRRGSKYSVVVGEIESGGAFGELALIHNDRRRATIVCMQDCEFLKINKPDFNEILKKNYQREWNARMEVLQNHPLFQCLHSSFINFAVEGSSIVEYPSDTVIVKDLTAPQSKVYFLVKGECYVVQQVSLLECKENPTNIQLVTECRKKKATVYIPPDTSIPSILIRNPKRKQISYQPPKQRTTRWWVVYTLQPGDYFGIGEGREGMSIVSKTRVELLTITAAIFKKYDKRQMMYRMRNEMSMLYPTQQEALRSYLDAIRWEEYKQKVLTETVEMGRIHRRKTNYE